MTKKFLSENKELMKEWDWEANAGLDPSKITLGSGKKSWWKCSKCGYEWQAVITSRGLKHRGCPACSNKVCVIGKNDLQTTHPDLASEWHPTKNGELKSINVIAGSHKKVWWQCSHCEHEWQAVVESRALYRRGCPACSNKFCVIGKNDLQTTHPELAKEWHPTENGNLKPTNVTAGYDKRVWWKCLKCGYEWQTTIADRSSRHRGCPQCRHAHKNKQLELF